jgi:transposase-like protein
VRSQLLGARDQRDQQGFGETLTKFARRRLAEDYPYLILDARYERVRDVLLDQLVSFGLALSALGSGSPTITFCRLPRMHHKHLTSTNMLERLNDELRPRTLVVRIFSQCQQLPTFGAGPLRRGS